MNTTNCSQLPTIGKGYMPAQPLEVTWNSVMSQDVITTDAVLVDSVSPTPVAVFTNPWADSPQGKTARIEALVLANLVGVGDGEDPQPQLCHVARNPQTDGGWSLKQLFGGRVATEVVAGASFSSIYGHFADSRGLYFTQLQSDGATWLPPQSILAEQVYNLKVAYWQNGLLVVYGNTAGGDLVTAYQHQIGGPFVATVTQVNGDLIQGDFHLIMLDERNWQLVTNVGGNPVIYTGELGATKYSSCSKTDGLPLNIKQIVFGYPSNVINTPFYLFVDDHNTLHMWAANASNLSPATRPIPYSNVTKATGHVSTDPDSKLHVYCVDDNQGLWVLHQDAGKPWNDDGTPNWMPFIALDKRIAHVASDMNPADAPTLFALDAADYSLRLRTQDPSNSKMWRSGRVLQHAHQAYEVVRFRTEVNLTDASGIPLPGYPVTVKVADGYSAADISVAGKTYEVDSNNAVLLTTGATGKLTIAVLTTAGMVAPNLVLSAEGLPAPVTIQPAGPLHNYLSGQGTLNPTNPNGPLPVFDAEGNTLKGARVGAQPLAPILQNDTSGLAGKAASAIRQTAAVGLGQNPQGAVGFHLSLAEPGRPTFTLLNTPEEVELRLTLLSEGPEASLGSILSDIGSLAGDVWEGIRNGVISIREVVVDVAKKVASFTVKIGERIVSGVKLALQGLEQAAQLIAGVFKMIEAEIELVIEWLMALFDFAAIWRTKMAFQQGLLNAPNYIRQITGLGQKAADGWFKKQKQVIDDALTALQNGYGDKTLGNQPYWQQPGSTPSNSTKVAGNATPADLTNNVHHNWLLDKIVSYSPDLGSVSTPEQPWQAMMTNLSAAQSAFISALGEFKDASKSLIEDPKSFGSVVIPDLIAMVRKLVDALLSLADAILDSFLALVDGAMDGLEALLSYELDLGPLNTIWGWIADLAGYPHDNKLTVGALLALLAAFPCTVIYKLIEGVHEEPFPDGKLQAHESRNLMAASRLGFQPTKGTMLAAGILQAIYFVPAVTSDLLGAKAPYYLTLFMLSLSLIMFVLVSGLPDLTVVEWGIIAAAVATLASVLLPAANSIIQTLYTAKVKEIMENPRFNDAILILTSMYGGGKFILGSIQTYLEGKNADPLQMEARWLLPLPYIYAWLQISDFRDDPEIAPFVMAAAVGLDLIGYIGAAADQIADAAMS